MFTRSSHDHKHHDDVVVFCSFRFFFFQISLSLSSFRSVSSLRLLTVFFVCRNIRRKKIMENISVIGVWHVNKNDDVAANIFPFIWLRICCFFSPICLVSLHMFGFSSSRIMCCAHTKQKQKAVKNNEIECNLTNRSFGFKLLVFYILNIFHRTIENNTHESYARSTQNNTNFILHLPITISRCRWLCGLFFLC